MNSEQRIFQVFRSGLHTAMDGRTMEFSDHDLQATAFGFDPTVRPACLTLGHPRDDCPNLGEVKRLFARQGKLYAVAQPSDTLVDLVRRGHYRHVSASFLPPSHRDNPTPGAYYLKHVGFLGATPPAVKGMTPPEFADGVVSLDFCDAGGTLDFSEGMTQYDPFDFAAPRGYGCDPARLAQHRLVMRCQQLFPDLSYADACDLALGLTF